MALARTTSLLLALLGVLALTAYGASRRAAQPARERMLSITGRLVVPLSPGVYRSLNLGVTNRYPFDLRITRLTVTVGVDSAHRRAGCLPSRDFVVRQLPARAYPIRVPGGSAVWLRSVSRMLPQVGMRNLPDVNQDACQGARLRLRYRASAVNGTLPRRLTRRG